MESPKVSWSDPRITGNDSRCPSYGECFCSNSFVKWSNANAKRVNTGSRPTATFQTTGVGSGSGISTDCHLCYAEQRRAGFGTCHPASPQKYTQKKMTKIMGIEICESGIRSCPESVGVGKFCRLRHRLRLRAKQPTPTDSDYVRSPGQGYLSSHMNCQSIELVAHPLQGGCGVSPLGQQLDTVSKVFKCLTDLSCGLAQVGVSMDHVWHLSQTVPLGLPWHQYNSRAASLASTC